MADESHRQTAWIQGFVVLVAVAIVGLITAINNYSKERQFRNLQSIANQQKTVTVIRQGQTLDMHQDDVLVGDIVHLYEGM